MNDLKMYAGLGAFHRGYAAGGYFGGPLGSVEGAALGILGGILGSRKQRKRDHQQAAKAWERLRPAYEAFEASLKGQSGETIRDVFTRDWCEFQKFTRPAPLTPDLPRPKRRKKRRAS